MRCNASFAWSMYRQLLLVAQAPGAPGASDWSEHFAHVSTLNPEGVLIVGDGRLTPAQRGDVDGWQKRTRHRAVLVTSSPLSRGIATALAWFGVPIKSFAPGQERRALEHLELAPEHHREAMELLARLSSALETRRARHSAPRV